MSLSVSAPIIDKCANCGKGEENSNNLKTCTACRLVKYCSRECQIAHRPQHKKACKKRAAELYDEALFKEVEPEECPICFISLPLHSHLVSFRTCCGKKICNGCSYEIFMSVGEDICAFCRTPPASTAEIKLKRLKNLMDKGNDYAYNVVAFSFAEGINSLPQDWNKANEFYLKAGDCAEAYYNLGVNFEDGRGVEVDLKKAQHYYELATIKGYVDARQNLGVLENEAGNPYRAVKHWILAARAGHKECLDAVKQGYMAGFVTKDEYANTLRAYHERQKEMKSDARDKAAASGLFSSG